VNCVGNILAVPLALPSSGLWVTNRNKGDMTQTTAKVVLLFATANHKYRRKPVLLPATLGQLILSQQFDSSKLQAEPSTTVKLQLVWMGAICARWLVFAHSLQSIFRSFLLVILEAIIMDYLAASIIFEHLFEIFCCRSMTSPCALRES